MSFKSYTARLTHMDGDMWTRCLTQFDDASIYQTWTYGAVQRGASGLLHLTLNAGDELVGCCQIATKRVGLLKIADVKWGPLWRKSRSALDTEVYAQLIRELQKFGQSQGYFVRVWPQVGDAYKDLCRMTLEREGFTVNPEETPYRTLKVDLSPPLEELRRNLLQKWRNCLNKAEKNGLQITEGTGDDLYGQFLTLAEEMCQRKSLSIGLDYYHDYRRIQADLPEALKMRIFVCTSNGEPVGVTICSAIGNTGIYLLGATAEKGLGLNGSYLVQWRIIERLKEMGIRYYDLGAFDPVGNPGVFHFKQGLAGRTGVEETFLGEYRGVFTNGSRLAMRGLEALRSAKSLLRRKR